MNFKLSGIAVACALALASSQAAASIALPNTGNGELFLVVLDTVSGSSYLKDLGIQQSAFQPTVAGTGVTTQGFGITYNLSTNLWSNTSAGAPGMTAAASVLSGLTSVADSNWGSFLSTTGDGRNLRYMVAAGESVGGTAANGVNYLMTSTTNPVAGKTNGNVTSMSGALANYLDFQNNLGSHSGPGTASVNGSSVTTVGDAFNFNTPNASAANMSATWNGLTATNLTQALGQSTSFWAVTRSSTTANAAARFDLYDNTVGPASWTLRATGTDYALSYTAPVPEPEAWALMIGGLGLIGMMARRRVGRG